MAELTIQVPDELAQRLQPFQNRLPELLSWLVETIVPVESVANLLPAVPIQADVPPVYSEVIDFLMTRPTPEQIANFKVSPEAQNGLRSLLEKNRKSSLSSREAAELDMYERLEQLMILLKAKSYSLIGK